MRLLLMEYADDSVNLERIDITFFEAEPLRVKSCPLLSAAIDDDEEDESVIYCPCIRLCFDME